MALLQNLCLLALACVAIARSPQHVGRTMEGYQDVRERMAAAQSEQFRRSQFQTRSSPQYLTNKTQQFVVNGTGIPEVSFDIGESYAGLLPISDNANETRQLYFWHFPSENALAGDEITIWLNGGPGCSSLEGLLQENGPFLWQYGTFKPVPNPWTWVNLTNMVWVEQPVGTGFSQGKVEAKSEEDIASEFMGFWKNFVDTFDLQGKKVYIAGESYAGQYIPYIASAMLNASDTTYFNLNGILIYDPSINYDVTLTNLVSYPFIEFWSELFALNDTFVANVSARDESCGYKAFRDEYLVFPPKGPIPSPPQIKTSKECDIYDDIQNAALLVNPCWDVYQVATTCPLLWDVLGFPGSFTYSPTGATIYFNRPAVKAAINAPKHVQWTECANENVYATPSGNSLNATAGQWSGLTVLPGVIDRLNKTIIGHGNLDMILLANGTLLTIQNMTWGGAQGFSGPVSDDFYVPYHADYELGAIAAAGVMGKTRTERGLTYVGIDLSGHMVPQYQPSAAYRHVEFLLGRVDSLSSKAPFTTSSDGLQAQPPGPIGGGR